MVPKAPTREPTPGSAATNAAPAQLTTLDLPIAGMCCASEVAQVEAALGKLAGVRDVRALVSAERATVTFDPHAVTFEQLQQAISGAGFAVRQPTVAETAREGRRELGQVPGWGMLGFVAVEESGALRDVTDGERNFVVRWPLVVGRNPASRTVQVVLSTFLTAQTINLPMLFMGAVVGAVPLVIIFLVVQRSIVEAVRPCRIKG